MPAYAKTPEATLNVPTLELYLRHDVTIWCQDAEGKYNIYKLTNVGGKLIVENIKKGVLVRTNESDAK